MVPAGNKAKPLSSVNHTTKTIRYHHHYHHHYQETISGSKRVKENHEAMRTQNEEVMLRNI